MKYLMVGGQFNDAGGRPSGYIAKLFDTFIAMDNEGNLVNGGNLNDLNRAISIDPSTPYKAIFWFAEVPNEKYRIKDIYPHIILVTSIKNNNEHGCMEIINRALKTRSNLIVSFNSMSENIEAAILDPLGNMFCRSRNIEQVAESLYKRVIELLKFTRISSIQINPLPKDIPDRPEFFEIVRSYGEIFHSIIHDHDAARFLGNASFRCESGFPSFRVDGSMIYVSRRNIDKRQIMRDNFVAVMGDCHSFNDNFFKSILFYGPNKPSVDAPIQAKLYRYYKDVHYMLHSHVYVQSAHFTQDIIPCGALEEFLEVVHEIPCRDSSNFCVNLRGHGSLVLARDLDFLKTLNFIPREIPEDVHG